MKYFGFNRSPRWIRYFGFYVTGQPNCTNKLKFTDKTKYTLSHIKPDKT